MDIKKGPLTAADLLEVWKGSVDEEFATPLIEAGDGEGFEAIGQSLAQHERAALAIDRTTQGMYILPHSSQTAPPASGASFAFVELTFERTRNIQRPLVLGAGQMMVEEETDDWGDDGPEPVLTGRRYVLVQTAFLPPGDPGPVTVLARSEYPGDGYNNPRPGTIKRIVQEGHDYTNDRAYLEMSLPAMVSGVPTSAPVPRAYARLVADNQADAPIPQHVGQYVLFTAGDNEGRAQRVVGYMGPQAPEHGGKLVLEWAHVVSGTTFSGEFIEGEQVKMMVGASIVGYMQCVATRTLAGRRFGVFDVADAIAIGETFVGTTSGAMLLADRIEVSAQHLSGFHPGSTVFRDDEWMMVEWTEHFGLVCSNAEFPFGGRLPMLDELGAERGVNRAPGEGDEPYRERVARIADNVSPNAIKRTINRVLVPHGKRGYLREVGEPSGEFVGFFYDGADTDPFDSAGAYDNDFMSRPEDRFKVWVDELEMRGFFLVGVPDFGVLGDFGFAYDGDSADTTGNPGAWDVGAFDSFPEQSTAVYRALWQALDQARAGGVGFAIYKETVDSTTG